MEIVVVSEVELADVLMALADGEETVDIESAFVTSGIHPEFGKVVCISGMSGKSAIIKFS